LVEVMDHIRKCVEEGRYRVLSDLEVAEVLSEGIPLFANALDGRGVYWFRGSLAVLIRREGVLRGVLIE